MNSTALLLLLYSWAGACLTIVCCTGSTACCLAGRDWTVTMFVACEETFFRLCRT